MTEMDSQFLKVIYLIPRDKAANSIYIAKQLGLPRSRIQSRVNLARLARLERYGYLKSIKKCYHDSKWWQITKEGIDKIEENGREENGSDR